MSAYLTRLLEVGWAARYVIAAVVFALMVAWILDLAAQRNQARADASRLMRRNAELRADVDVLRGRIRAMQRRGAGKAGPARREAVQ